MYVMRHTPFMGFNYGGSAVLILMLMQPLVKRFGGPGDLVSRSPQLKAMRTKFPVFHKSTVGSSAWVSRLLVYLALRAI